MNTSRDSVPLFSLSHLFRLFQVGAIWNEMTVSNISSPVWSEHQAFWHHSYLIWRFFFKLELLVLLFLLILLRLLANDVPNVAFYTNHTYFSGDMISSDLVKNLLWVTPFLSNSGRSISKYSQNRIKLLTFRLLTHISLLYLKKFAFDI